LPLEHTVFKGGVKEPLSGGGTRNGTYNWGWPHGNMTLRVGGSTGPGLTFAPGEAKMLTYTTSQSGDFNAHDMIEKPPAWLPTHAGQPRDLGPISGKASDRIAISTALATWENSDTSYAGQDFQTTFDFRCEPRAIHDGHSWRFQGQMFSSQVGWRHESANPRIAFISERNFPSTTIADLDGNPMPFLHLDLRLKTLDEARLPNKTWLHTIPFHPFVAATSTAKHRSKGVDASTTFFAHPFTITFEQVSGVEGVFQNRPFFGPSNRPGGQSRIVSAPIPLAPLTSLAQLQNLPLLPIDALNWSGYYLQNHAIGNSFASPGLRPTATRENSFPFYLGQYQFDLDPGLDGCPLGRQPETNGADARGQPTEHPATGYPCRKPQSESGRRRHHRGKPLAWLPGVARRGDPPARGGGGAAGQKTRAVPLVGRIRQPAADGGGGAGEVRRTPGGAGRPQG
jgi:hypothetical protein